MENFRVIIKRPQQEAFVTYINPNENILDQLYEICNCDYFERIPMFVDDEDFIILCDEDAKMKDISAKDITALISTLTFGTCEVYGTVAILRTKDYELYGTLESDIDLINSNLYDVVTEAGTISNVLVIEH